MKYTTLGASGIAVSRLCLGTMLFGGDRPATVDAAGSERIIDTFLDAGGTYLDTANRYAGGRSEEVLGAALRGRRQSVVLASKGGAQLVDRPLDPGAGLTRTAVLTEIESSLRRLETDYIDLWYLHGPDRLTAIEETWSAVETAWRAGKIRAVGLSNFPAWSAAEAVLRAPMPVVAAQYQYSLVCRDIEDDFFDGFRRHGIAMHCWGPLGQGFLTGKYRPGDQPGEGRIETAADADEEHWTRRNTDANWSILSALRTIADRHDATPAQIALAWTLARPAVAVTVVGARTAAQLEESLGATEVTLEAAELAELDAVSRPPKRYPYRVIDRYFDRRVG